MNRYQDALNRIVDDDYEFYNDYYEEDKAVAKERDIETLQELVDKATPQKPSIEDDTWYCPDCEAEYELDYHEYEYCPKCGQPLDWSEEEDEDK